MIEHHKAYEARTYMRAGHSKKLIPIIENLSKLDFTIEAWSDVKQRVNVMEEAFRTVMLTVPFDSPDRIIVQMLLDLSRAALRAHDEVFLHHRRLCVDALHLKVADPCS